MDNELYRTPEQKKRDLEDRFIKEAQIAEMKKKLQLKIDMNDPEVYNAFKIMISGSEETDDK